MFIIGSSFTSSTVTVTSGSSGATPRVRGRDADSLAVGPSAVVSEFPIIFVVQHRRCAQLAGRTDAEVGIVSQCKSGLSLFGSVALIGFPSLVPTRSFSSTLRALLSTGVSTNAGSALLGEGAARTVPTETGPTTVSFAVLRVGGLHSATIFLRSSALSAVYMLESVPTDYSAGLPLPDGGSVGVPSMSPSVKVADHVFAHIGVLRCPG